MKDPALKLAFVTHNPHLSRRRKIINSLSKKYKLTLVEPLLKSGKNKLLKADFNTAVRLSTLGLKSILIQDPVLLDVLACFFFPYKLKRYVVDYPTPLSKEIKWLGNRVISQVVSIQEKIINKNAVAVIVPNEPMEYYCHELGAENICVIPNYPHLNFRPSISSNIFKKKCGIPKNSKIALFTVGDRLKEIYGLDLLLESWKIIEKILENVLLVFIGPRQDAEMTSWQVSKYAQDFGLKKMKVIGWVDATRLTNWINTADVCLAPRTPGFPSKWYNDKDSTKISEYAALRKPIVAAGYSSSNQYHVVDRTPEAFAEGILRAFEGKIKPAEPHYWEENEQKLYEVIELLYHQ